jgi:hypothetical protein
MSLANDWDTLGKAERKARLELAIGEAIDRIAAQAVPTDWQKGKILHAIDATTRGLFDVAATHLSQVFVEGTADRPWPNPDIDSRDLDKITVMTLRRELDRLKARPVQDPPDYL